MIRIGALLSGRGSNLGAILGAIDEGRIDAEVRVAISNVAGAKGLERAEAKGVPTAVVDHKAYASRGEFERAIVTILRQHDVDWVVLAGFMRIVTEELLGAFPMRVINVHPALLPSFPGVDAQGQALDYGVRVAGCSVHFVDVGTDTGPILAQAVVPVLEGDDHASLAARVLAMEHTLLPLALGWIAEGRVTVEPALPGKRPRVRVRGVVPVLGLAS